MGRLVAEGETATAFAGREQIVAGKQEVGAVLRVRAVDDFRRQIQGAGAFDAPFELLIQDPVVDGREVFANVALEHVGVVVRPAGGGVERGVGAEPDPAGVGFAYEAWFEHGFENLGEGVVDDAVAEGGGGDLAHFGVADDEGAVGAGPVVAGFQFAGQDDEAGFPVEEEGGDVGPAAFAEGGAVEGEGEVGP